MKTKILTTITLLMVSISSSFASSMSGTYACDSLLSKIIQVQPSNLEACLSGLIIVCACIMLFVDLQGGYKRLLKVLAGLMVIFGAAPIISSLFLLGAVI